MLLSARPRALRRVHLAPGSQNTACDVGAIFITTRAGAFSHTFAVVTQRSCSFEFFDMTWILEQKFIIVTSGQILQPTKIYIVLDLFLHQQYFNEKGSKLVLPRILLRPISSTALYYISSIPKQTKKTRQKNCQKPAAVSVLVQPIQQFPSNPRTTPGC